jgi:hypothetical protein
MICLKHFSVNMDLIVQKINNCLEEDMDQHHLLEETLVAWVQIMKIF